MAELVTLRIDGHTIHVEEGTTVLAAVLGAKHGVVRRSVTGERRGPLCGMGICFECRLMIDGFDQVKSCQTLVAEGMEVLTDA